MLAVNRMYHEVQLLLLNNYIKQFQVLDTLIHSVISVMASFGMLNVE